MRQIVNYFVAVIMLLSCEKNDIKNNADEYMDKVKSETYSDMFLPDLEPQDISSLLKYRDDKTILKKFPTNPISCLIGDSVTVGNIALWTIESIRISELNGDTSVYKRFPSLNPIILDTNSIIANKFSLQDSVARRYYNWWCQTDLSQVEKLQINPLQGSRFVWR